MNQSIKALRNRINRLNAAIALYEMTDCAHTKLRLATIISALSL